MDYSLPPRLAKLVKEQVEAGRFSDGHSFVCEALEEWAKNHLEPSEDSSRLRESVARGLKEADANEIHPGEETLERLLQRDRSKGDTGS